MTVERLPSSDHSHNASHDHGALDYRQAPHNMDAEQALLGAILVNNEAHFRVSDFLDKNHFFEPLHARIYEQMGRLLDQSHVVTPVTLQTYFTDDTALQEVGGATYFLQLAAAAPTISHARDYGRTIYDLSLRRQLIQMGEDIVVTAYDAPIESSPTEQIEQIEGRLYSLAETGRSEKGFEPFSQSSAKALELALAAFKRDGGTSGVSTGLIDLDKKMGGLQKSDLIILAGRPGMGKTALATNIAFNIAKDFREGLNEDNEKEVIDGGRVAFYSLEMSSEQLATRILSQEAKVGSDKIRKGLISDDDYRRLASTTTQLQNIPLYIDQTGGISISALTQRARRLKRTLGGLDLIVVDYLQLLTPSGKKRSDGRVQEVSEITQGLKALAKDLEVPVLALSQLSRAVEQRDDKRPLLSDLRESGSIEQDADIVMFVYREAYYKKSEEPADMNSAEFAEWQENMQKIFHLAEVIIEKQRHGPTGKVKLRFDENFTRFENLFEGAPLADGMNPG